MILVTGGSGLVGQEVLRELAARGHACCAMVRSDRASRTVIGLGAKPIAGTVEDPDAWRQLPPLVAIVHSAALIAQHEPWSRFEEVNVGGTRLAAETARRLSVPLIHISSVAVYGRRAGDDGPETVTEQYRLGPLGRHEFYARSKRQAEAVALEQGGGRVVALRPCVIYGPGDRLFLPKLLSFARHNRIIPLAGSGNRPLPLVHSSSVALAVVCALRSTGRSHWGRPYNITGDATVTARDVVAALERFLGEKFRTLTLPVAPLLGLASLFEKLRGLVGRREYPGSFSSAVRFWRGGNPYSSSAAREALGWRPQLDAATALGQALAAAGHSDDAS